MRMREETTLVCVDVKDEIFSCNKKMGSEDTVVGRDYDDEKEERLLMLSPVVVGRGRFEVGNRRVTPSVKMDFTVEKALPNGDLYAGRFSSNVPHGKGKYLWSDGCMYEGEWKKGKASGKGKFSWPSGATYVGEFKSGRMEGFGTLIGSDGDTYRGNWVGDRKQGYGKKWYANGDHYEGMWKTNMQDGQGTYVWSTNGNEYSGEWKNGVMSGCGTLTWANGDRYEGMWENGVMKGSCVFISADKLHNDGDLCLESGKEVRLKEVCLVGMAKENGVGLLGGSGNLRKCSSVDGPRGSMTEKPFPRICIWESDGEDGDITCDIIDNFEASMFYHDGTGLLDMDGIKQFSCSIYRTPSEVKKPGKTVSKGHKNYELMLNLQLGIRYTVGKHASVSRQLKPSDFEPKEKFWTRFPPEGSKTTPPHLSMDFRWKDYCPVVFRHLRELFRVDPADYMLAICGNASLRELSSPGKSGSVFYLTQDEKYIIKTVKKSEVKVLIKMLPSYFEHMRKYENSLVTKFFGVHCVKPAGGQKTRFIVMGNLFSSDFPIHRRFDLKGSSHGRTTDKRESKVDETTTLKDLDLNYVFRLQKNFFEELNKQIELDCEFLEAERIMDYSLLVGMHFRDENTRNKIGLSPFVLRSGKSNTFQNEKFMRDCRFLDAELQDMDRVISGRKPLIRLGSNMPARAERRARESDVDPCVISRSVPQSREVYEVVLYFGIIDILQDYDITKKLEHVYKSLQADPTSISAVDPKLYSKRFRDFMKRIFVENR